MTTSTVHTFPMVPPTSVATPSAANDATRARYRPNRALRRPKKNVATVPTRIQRATAIPATFASRPNFECRRSGPKKATMLNTAPTRARGSNHRRTSRRTPT